MTVTHRGDSMKFIITQSESVAGALIKSGYEPLPNMGSGFFIFKNEPSIRKFCKENLENGAYVFTDKIFL